MSKEPERRPNFVSALKDPAEKKKRRKELFAVVFLGLLFLVLTWIEFKLFDVAKTLPFVHSIFFIGLVNFNIILFLILLFFIFRNVVKVFTEKRNGIFGGSLKSKLIAAFVAFSMVPTLLMFVISVFYINNSFDKWFSEKMSGVLKSSLEVTNAYFSNAKKKNYHFAREIIKNVNFDKKTQLPAKLEQYRGIYSLDSVEYYETVFTEPLKAVASLENIPDIPEVSLEFKKKGLIQNAEASTIHHFKQGNLIRVIVPVSKKGKVGALVVSTYVPMSLIAKMDDIASAYQDFRDVNPIEYPLKSIYLTLLVLMSLVIMLFATWFGFYLARQLSVPLQILGETTRDISKGDYQPIEIETGSNEINELILNFNSMTKTIEKSEKDIMLTNHSLEDAIHQLDEHSKYMEIVLSNVTTGVISVDSEGFVTVANQYAQNMLKVKRATLLGNRLRDVLSTEDLKPFKEIVEEMREDALKTFSKEISINVKDRQLPVRVTVTSLSDENFEEIGLVFVFDDLTHVVRAQRAAAWTEVARRIAHEIKNPLTPIRLAAQRLQKKFGGSIEDKAFKDCTSMIIEQVDDLKQLVNEFSHFARLPESTPQQGNMNLLIEQSVGLYAINDAGVAVKCSLDKSLPDFKFDSDQMKRVLTNLIENSMAALVGEKSGEIIVQTQYDRKLKILKLIVTDNGPGVSPRMMDRIFEPYITTKTQGTGLGLAIVKRMIEDHNGYIRAFHNQPRGLKMQIELPVLPEQAKLNRKYDDKGQGITV